MENSKAIFVFCCKQSTKLSHSQGDQITSKEIMIAFARIKLTLGVLFIYIQVGLRFPSGETRPDFYSAKRY